MSASDCSKPSSPDRPTARTPSAGRGRSSSAPRPTRRSSSNPRSWVPRRPPSRAGQPSSGSISVGSAEYIGGLPAGCTYGSGSGSLESVAGVLVGRTIWRSRSAGWRWSRSHRHSSTIGRSSSGSTRRADAGRCRGHWPRASMPVDQDVLVTVASVNASHSRIVDWRGPVARPIRASPCAAPTGRAWRALPRDP